MPCRGAGGQRRSSPKKPSLLRSVSGGRSRTPMDGCGPLLRIAPGPRFEVATPRPRRSPGRASARHRDVAVAWSDTLDDSAAVVVDGSLGLETGSVGFESQVDDRLEVSVFRPGDGDRARQVHPRRAPGSAPGRSDVERLEVRRERSLGCDRLARCRPGRHGELDAVAMDARSEHLAKEAFDSCDGDLRVCVHVDSRGHSRIRFAHTSPVAELLGMVELISVTPERRSGGEVSGRCPLRRSRAAIPTRSGSIRAAGRSCRCG